MRVYICEGVLEINSRPLKSLAHPAHSNHLDNLILLDPILAPLPTETRVLDATERRGGVGDETRVDADHADLERLRDAVAALDVLAEEVAGEADVGGVRGADDFGFTFEGEEARYGAEGLLAH